MFLLSTDFGRIAANNSVDPFQKVYTRFTVYKSRLTLVAHHSILDYIEDLMDDLYTTSSVARMVFNMYEDRKHHEKLTTR